MRPILAFRAKRYQMNKLTGKSSLLLANASGAPSRTAFLGLLASLGYV